MTLLWQAEPFPPPPRGALARGSVLPALAASMLRQSERFLPMQLVAHSELCVLLGDADSLPWLPGIEYLAPREHAPQLWLPTTTRPAMPLDLVCSALLRRGVEPPFLLLPNPAIILSLASALGWADCDPQALVRHWRSA